MKQGSVRIAGHVNAHCLVCRRDVFVPEDTLTCPYGDHDVEPTSLPKAEARPAPAPAVTPVPPRERKAPAAEPERIVLPVWMDEATAWLAATERLAGKLTTEDASSRPNCARCAAFASCSMPCSNASSRRDRRAGPHDTRVDLARDLVRGRRGRHRHRRGPPVRPLTGPGGIPS